MLGALTSAQNLYTGKNHTHTTVLTFRALFARKKMERVTAENILKLAADHERHRVYRNILKPMRQLAKDEGFTVFDIPENWFHSTNTNKARAVQELQQRGFRVAFGHEGITVFASSPKHEKVLSSEVCRLDRTTVAPLVTS